MRLWRTRSPDDKTKSTIFIAYVTIEQKYLQELKKLLDEMLFIRGGTDYRNMARIVRRRG